MLKLGHFPEYDPFEQNESITTFLQKVNNSYGRMCLFLSQYLHLPFEVVLEKSGGEHLQNDTFTGLLGMVQRSEIDIAVAPFDLTGARNKVLNFTYPFYIEYVTFVTTKPEYSPRIFAAFYPFTFTTWMILIGAILVFIILKYIVSTTKYSLSTTALDVLSILLKQDMVILPSDTKESFLASCWMIGMGFISMIYCSVLLSFLTFPPLAGVRDVTELAAAVTRGEYSCIMRPYTSFPLHLSTAPDERMRVIGENMLQNSLDYIYLDDFLKNPNKRVAYIAAKSLVSFLKEKYFVSQDYLMQIMLSFAVRKDFCCTNKLNMAVHTITSSGLYQKVSCDKENFQSRSVVEHKIDDTISERKLSLIEVGGAFIILIVGCTISVAVLIIEILVSKMESI